MCDLQGEREFKLEPILDDHEALMEKINSWNFQIFDLVERTGGKTGRILSYVSNSTLYASVPDDCFTHPPGFSIPFIKWLFSFFTLKVFICGICQVCVPVK